MNDSDIMFYWLRVAKNKLLNIFFDYSMKELSEIYLTNSNNKYCLNSAFLTIDNEIDYQLID
jgi:hypothetical protein